jgi:hypothetical protein
MKTIVTIIKKERLWGPLIWMVILTTILLMARCESRTEYNGNYHSKIYAPAETKINTGCIVAESENTQDLTAFVLAQSTKEETPAQIAQGKNTAVETGPALLLDENKDPNNNADKKEFYN